MADRKRPKQKARPEASRARALTTTWAAVVIALLVIVFFHQLIVGGKTFLSPDANQPAGFVRMGEKSLWEQHVYPLWNPFVFLGMPSFASGAYNPLIYPPDWPLALIAKVLPMPEYTWLLLYYVVGGLGLFLLAREWGARAEGALLGAVAFVFAPNLVAIGSHGHGSQLVDSAYLPLMVWLAARWLKRGGPANLAWLALAGGFQLLRGHVQVCFYTWIAIVLFGLVAWAAAWSRPGEIARNSARLLGLFAAAGLAFGLAGFYNLPLRDYAQYSIRGGGADGGVGMTYATQWSLAPYELPSIVAPNWAGFGGATYWGSMPFTDYPNAYVGMVTMLLLIPAFLRGGMARSYALVLGAVSLMIAFGRHFPLYGFLYDHLPLFNKFRIPVMVIVLFQLAAALGLAWGWSDVLDASHETKERRHGPALDKLLLALGALLAAAFALVVLFQDAWRGAYIALATSAKSTPDQKFGEEVAAFAYRSFVQDWGRVAVIGLLAVGAAWLARRAKLSASLASALVLVLLLIELWPVSGRVMQPVVGDKVTRNLEIGRDDVVDFLEQAGPPGTFRVFPPDEMLSNRYAGFGIGTIGGYHAAKPRLFQDLMDGENLNNLGWMRLLNVRFVVLAQKLETPPLYLREVHSGSATVYENLLALPRATVVSRYRVVRPARAILDSVKSGTSESADLTFLEEDPGVTLGPSAGARAEIVSYRVNDVAIEVETKGPALLRLADLWYPDWSATVDGAPVRIFRADYLLRAVPVAAGKHRVEFHFRSKALRAGLFVSLASLALVLALFAWAWLAKRRVTRRPESAPAAVTGAG